MCFGRKNRKIRKHREDLIDAEHEARMEKAVRDVDQLRVRADAALDTLDTRDRRNHWRESIEQMIQGAT